MVDTVSTMVNALELLPAVDVQAGRAVQLIGDALGSSRDFGDPVAAALSWQATGARWIHLVDLDAAFERGDNGEVVREIVGRLEIPVQLSGGIVAEDRLAAAMAAGCRRAVLGAGALGDRRWCSDAIDRYGDRVAVGLDVRHRTVSPRGSGGDVGPLDEAIEWLERAGCHRYVVTDVERDGALTGPNLDLLSDVAGLTTAPLVACGGITTLDDLSALRRVGVEGAIIGTALYEGRLTLEDALAAAVR